MEILYLQNNHPHLNWWTLASLPILQIDMDISVFGWLFLSREKSIYLNLSLHAGINFLQFLNGWSFSAITVFKVFQIWIIYFN